MSAVSSSQSAVRVTLAVLSALGVAIMLSLVLLALNFASARLPRDPIIDAVRQGFAQRQLVDYGWLHLNAELGVHQFNDCLILLMAADDRAPADKRALSPTIAGASVGAFGGGFTVPCPPLRRFANGERAPITDTSFYHRYVFGNVALTAGLLQFSSIQGLRTTYSFLAFAAPLTMSVLALFFLWRAKAPTRPNTLAFAALGGVMLSFFFAAQYYGQSIAHFPPDILLTLYLLTIACLRSRAENFFALGAINAAFGALTMYFEFLSGGAPMGAALVLSTAAVQSLDRKDGQALLRAGFALATYAIGFLTIFAIKQTATSIVFGADVVANSGARLETWLTGATPLQTFWRLDQNIREFGGGSIWIGRGIVLGAALALITSVVQLVLRKRGPRAPEWVFVAAALIIPAWYLIFSLHTYVHAWMMVRIVVMFNLAGYFLFATLNRDRIAAVVTRLAERWRG